MGVQHYHGSCQCGAVAFEADLDLDQAVTCNCSRCRRLGSVFAFTPEAGFLQTKGAGSLTEYRFNKMVIAHQFCPVCGIEPFGMGTAPDGSAVVAVNVRTLDGVDAHALAKVAHHYDGASV